MVTRDAQVHMWHKNKKISTPTPSASHSHPAFHQKCPKCGQNLSEGDPSQRSPLGRGPPGVGGVGTGRPKKRFLFIHFALSAPTPKRGLGSRGGTVSFPVSFPGGIRGHLLRFVPWLLKPLGCGEVSQVVLTLGILASKPFRVLLGPGVATRRGASGLGGRGSLLSYVVLLPTSGRRRGACFLAMIRLQRKSLLFSIGPRTPMGLPSINLLCFLRSVLG